MHSSLFFCIVVIIQNGKNEKTTYSLVEYNANSFVMRFSVHSFCVLVSSLQISCGCVCMASEAFK